MYPTPRPSTVAGVVARAAVVALLAMAVLVGVGAGPTGDTADAADDTPWTVGTATNEFGSDRKNYSYTADPGGHIEDGLVVANHGTTSLDLAVYSADAFTTDAGRLDLVTKDTTSTGVGAWVHPRQDRLTIAPGQSVEVPFTVAVPDNAAPGDHMGGIVTSLTRDGVERRVGMRIRMRVGGELKPNLSVDDASIQYSGTSNPFGKGEAAITYTIRNTGNAILAARQEVSVSGPLWSEPVPSGNIDDSPQLLPGETWKVSVPVQGVTPELQLTATVSLVPLLTDASGSIAPLAAIEGTAHAWAMPWTLLLLAVLCGVVVVVLVSRRRRRRASRAG